MHGCYGCSKKNQSHGSILWATPPTPNLLELSMEGELPWSWSGLVGVRDAYKKTRNGLNWHLTWPKGSMGLVYLPTFTINLFKVNVRKYSIHGLSGIDTNKNDHFFQPEIHLFQGPSFCFFYPFVFRDAPSLKLAARNPWKSGPC